MVDDPKPTADDVKPPVTIASTYSNEEGWASKYKDGGGYAGLEKALRDAPPPPATPAESAPPPPPTADDPPARLAVPNDFAGYMEARARLMAEHEDWLDTADARRSTFRGKK